MKSDNKFILIMLAFSIMSGCAGFRADRISDLSDTDLGVARPAKVKIFYDNQFDSNMLFLTEKNRQKAAAEQKQNFSDQISQAGCCELVEERGKADLVVTARFGSHANNAAFIGAYITGYTLFTIPSWITPKLSYKAEVVAPNRVPRHYEYRDHFTMVQWLPMILAFPFANPMPMEKDIQLNMYRHLIADMEAEGLLVAKGANVPDGFGKEVAMGGSEPRAPAAAPLPSLPRANPQPAATSEAALAKGPGASTTFDALSAAKQISVSKGCSSQVTLEYESAGGYIFRTSCGRGAVSKIMCDPSHCRLME